MKSRISIFECFYLFYFIFFFNYYSVFTFLLLLFQGASFILTGEMLKEENKKTDWEGISEVQKQMWQEREINIVPKLVLQVVYIFPYVPSTILETI